MLLRPFLRGVRKASLPSGLSGKLQKGSHSQQIRTTAGFSEVRFVESWTHGGKPLPELLSKNGDASPGAENPRKERESLNKQVYRLGSDPIRLRDMCRCDQCVDPSTRQRNFSFADIPLNIQVKSMRRDEEGWVVTWKNDIGNLTNHFSKYSWNVITEILTMLPYRAKRVVEPWRRTEFERETKDIDYHSLLTEESALLETLHLISKHGLVFVRSVPEDHEAVRKLANRIGLLRNTFYGETWDVRSVPQAKNVAYTSKFLGYHMDLLYMKEPPGLQLLHCIRNTCEGGDSLFADTFKAIDELSYSSPDLLEVLRQSHIRYTYNNDGQFYTDVKPVVKSDSGPQGAFKIMRNLSGKKTDMVTLDRVYWSPPFIGSIQETKDTYTLVEASKQFQDLLESPQLTYQTKMEPGTCAIFDNLRVVHARNEFDVNSGERWLKGAYADHQDVYSKLFVRHKEVLEVGESLNDLASREMFEVS